jgi:hypothetical protein
MKKKIKSTPKKSYSLKDCRSEITLLFTGAVANFSLLQQLGSRVEALILGMRVLFLTVIFLSLAFIIHLLF